MLLSTIHLTIESEVFCFKFTCPSMLLSQKSMITLLQSDICVTNESLLFCSHFSSHFLLCVHWAAQSLCIKSGSTPWNRSVHLFVWSNITEKWNCKLPALFVGSLFASVAWAELLGALIGNVTLTTIYRVTLIPTMLNGLVFLVMALLYIIVIFLVTWVSSLSH